MSLVSIITPFLDEQEMLPIYQDRVLASLGEMGHDHEYEIVLVDDHSTDGSSGMAKRWAIEDARVRYIRLSRSCGSHAAYSAGLAECSGDCAVLLAADLQDPPEMMPKMLESWSAGSDMVWATRSIRESGTWMSRIFGDMYYHAMRRFALSEIPAKGVGFLLLGRKVIDAYDSIREKNTDLFVLLVWMGFRQSFVEYVPPARLAGKSKWTMSAKIKIFIDSMVSFSYVPIRLMSYMGFAMAFCGFIYALVVIVGRLGGWVTAGTGFAALMTVLLVGQGMIMTMLGVLGEYLWRAFDEARGRPRYIVEERLSAEHPHVRALDEDATVSTGRKAK